MKKSKIRMSGMGIITILTVFVVLCMTIFALLTLMTANNTLSNTEKSAAAIQNFYNADYIATEKLSSICGIVKSTKFNELSQKLSPLDLEIKAEGELLAVSYTVSVNGNMDLAVQIDIGKDKSVNITKWQTISKDDFIYEDEIPVWNGENIF